MKKILAIFICLLITQVCFGIEEVKKISLSSAIELALKENPQNKMAKLDTEIAKREVKEASHLQNPAIQFFQNLGRAGAGNPQQLGLAYELELFKPLKRKKAAKYKISISENNQKNYENELIYRVKTAYFDLLESKTNLGIIKQQRDVLKDILDNAIKEEQKGSIPKTDVVLAKIEHNRFQMFYNQAQADLISKRNKFNAVMNSSELEFDTLQDKLDENYSALLTIKPTNNIIDFEKIKQYVYTHRYDIISAKQEVEQKKAELSVIKSQLAPNLELIGGWSYQTQATSESDKFENGAYLGANLTNIPVIYQYKPEIEKAKYEIEKAELKYQDLIIDVTRNLSDAWENYCVTRDNLNFYDKELRSNSQELVEASIKSLKQKKIDMTYFLLMRKTYIELVLGYSDALNNYYRAYAELLKEINIQDINELL
ncbi:TolC family protein [bacterium]|nr:TolC family protein [bacterium]